jgi:glycosyltransferase involved in cell wall biosynthesis
MRILNVNATMDPVWGGGSAERVRCLSSALARLGHSVTVLTTHVDREPSKMPHVEGVQVVALRCLNQRFMLPLTPIGPMRDLVRAQDIVHLSGHWTALNALVYILCKLEDKPYAVSPVGTLPRFGRSRKLKAIYNAVVGRVMIRNASAKVAVTHTEIPQFADYGVPARGITVIPNGVDREAFEEVDPMLFRKKYNFLKGPFILFMGRLNSIKGPDLLLTGFARIAAAFPDYRLVFAGPNEGMEAALRESAQQSGLEDRVHFVGYVGGREKVAAYRAATLLAIPSRMEAMSIVVLEGGAAGTPVLITDQCGFDILEQIGGGKVVAANADAIANGLAAMLSQPEKLACAGRKLQELVQKDFTWDVAAVKLAALFQAVVLASGAR